VVKGPHESLTGTSIWVVQSGSSLAGARDRGRKLTDKDMSKIKVVLVDDHPVVREGLRTMLATTPDIDIVAEASDGLEAVDKVLETQPDVVLMDLRMPNLDGLEATKRIKNQLSSTAIIVLTIYDNDAYIIDAVRAGAVGYLLKDTSRDLLIHAIRAVSSGGMLLKPCLLREAMMSLTSATSGEQRKGKSGTASSLDELTRREQDVLRLVVLGRSNKEIGQELSISEDTAKKHVQTIMLKMGVSDRTQAAVKAVRAGMADQLPEKTL
jgi:DNA-binding NarL/FixJ family response regulator